MRKWIAGALAVVACVSTVAAQDNGKEGGKEAKEERPEIQRRTLENGLQVVLRPVKGAKTTAVVVRFAVGEGQDPAGRSGMHHLLEHLYVTCAAGDAPARTVEELFRAYPGGHTAQTTEESVLVAAIVPSAELDAELVDAAARIGDLRITAADLAREVPQVGVETENMFGGIPAIGVANLARERLFPPTGEGWRRGGLVAQLREVTAEEATAVWKRNFKPRHARLVLVGTFDPAATLERIEKLFGPISGGDEIPFPPRRRFSAFPPAADRGKLTIVDGASDYGGQGPHACVAWMAPFPANEHLYPAFLVLVSRLWKRGPSPQVRFAPLDDPDALFVVTPLAKDDDPAAEAAHLEQLVREAAAPQFAKSEATAARLQLAHLLGTAPLPDAAIAMNPYPTALRLAHWDGYADPAAIGEAMSTLTEETFRRAMEQMLDFRVAVVLRPR